MAVVGMGGKKAIVKVLGALGAAYAISSAGVAVAGAPWLRAYIMRPVAWVVLAWLVDRLPAGRPAARLRLRPVLVQLALVMGTLQVIVALLLGLLDGFGRSPYARDPLGILVNLVLVGATLLGMEYSRAWLVNALQGRGCSVLPVVAVGVLYVLIQLPPAKWSGLATPVNAVRFAGGTLLPYLSESLLATYLAFLGGPWPAIAYRGLGQAFTWFSPILPDSSWAMGSLTGTVVPLLGLVVVQAAHAAEQRPRRRRREAGGGAVGWVVASVFGVVLVWFSVGLFPVHPTVVISGSMRPVLDVGDIAIVARVDPGRVKVGDVLEFRREQIPVLHRVIEVQNARGVPAFVTKGDANSTPDRDVVLPEHVRGKVVGVVPRLGWVSLAVKGLLIR